MSKISEQKNAQRLKHRWVFEQANYLICEENMKRREAFNKAYLTWRLLEAMGQGVVPFRYEKKTGEVREARGTLCSGIAADFDNYEYQTEEHKAFGQADNHGVFVYFDLDENGFRSFAAKRLIDVSFNNDNDERTGKI